MGIPRRRPSLHPWDLGTSCAPPLAGLWEPVWAETRPSDWPNVQSVSRFDHRAHNPASSCDRRESCRRIGPPRHEEDTRDRKQKRGARSGRRFLRDSGAVRSRNTRLIFAFESLPAGISFGSILQIPQGQIMSDVRLIRVTLEKNLRFCWV